MAEAVAKALRLSYARTEGISLTANQLKVIAILAMVFDHCMVAFVPHELAIYPFLRMPGRITAPTMCFLIAEGYHHTSNLKKYMGRLLLMAVISHVPFNLFFGYDLLAFWKATDVIWSLLLGLIALTAYKCTWLKLWQKIILIGVCCLFAYSADWNYIAVLMVLGFGAFYKNKNMQTVVQIAICVMYGVQALLYGASLVIRIGILLSIPLLRLYNGQRGKKSIYIQWGFYWFYPMHLLALYLLCKLF